jgi:hypothetical protein
MSLTIINKQLPNVKVCILKLILPKITRPNFLYLIISFMCLATNCVTNIDQSKRENKK